MQPVIRKLAENTKNTYSEMLKKFRPCKPGSEFLEQNLITLLSSEFLKMFPKGIAFSEVPFITGNEKNQWGSRLDAYLANETDGYLVEAKGSQSKELLFQLIEDDLKRINSEDLEVSFNQMATDGDRNYAIPDTVRGLIIADCWSSATIEQWGKNELLEDRFPHISKLSTESFEVGEFGGFTYHILVGQTAPLWRK